MADLAGAPFLFGKLPAHGDFVSRGLSDAARQAWDDWATAAIERLRALGGDFEATHDAAPPWRFIAGPSALGEGWRVGALAPSIDAAGRRFMLALGFTGAVPGVAAAIGEPLAEGVEDILYRALAEQLPADQVIELVADQVETLQHVSQGAATLNAAPLTSGAWWSEGSDQAPIRLAAPPTDLLCLELPGLSENAA